MQVDLFDFDLPPELIAHRPAEPREAARLLHVGAGEKLADRLVADLPDLVGPGDLLVFNDTKVIPARLHGRRGLVEIEVTLLRPTDGARWRAFARPGKRLRAGDRIDFADDFSAGVVAKLEGGEVELELRAADLRAALERHGSMPLPPYIKRDADSQDRHDYQTIFAAQEGAIAAPTAGLHFTQALLDRIVAAGASWTLVTLHVGAGTFLPVKVADTDEHVMHAEWGRIDAETAARIQAAERVVAVGTTSLRVLESAAAATGRVEPFAGETRLFITPGYQFNAVDRLITNFHLPRSTLFMLVSAFAGLERMKAAYAHAMAERYRFFSYGDASLLERGDR